MHKKLKIKRINKEIGLPEYKTKGSAAFDFTSRDNVVIPPKEIRYVSLNVCIKIPKNFTLLMAPRSSMHKRGLMLVNSIAVFDEDFCGDDDEYKAAVYNFSDKDVSIEVGDRLTQGFLVSVAKANWHEVHKMNEKSRGGFGSTGKK